METLASEAVECNGAPTSKRIKLIKRCTFTAGQPLVTHPDLAFISQREPTQIGRWPILQPFDLAALPANKTPQLVTAICPAPGVEYTFRGLAANGLIWPKAALTCPAQSFISVVVRGVVRAEVANLSRDSVYGGGIYLASSGQDKLFKLRYSFKAPQAGGERVGVFLEKLSSTEAIILVQCEP